MSHRATWAPSGRVTKVECRERRVGYSLDGYADPDTARYGWRYDAEGCGPKRVNESIRIRQLASTDNEVESGPSAPRGVDRARPGVDWLRSGQACPCLDRSVLAPDDRRRRRQ